jgi:hypothetical protein
MALRIGTGRISRSTHDVVTACAAWQSSRLDHCHLRVEVHQDDVGGLVTVQFGAEFVGAFAGADGLDPGRVGSPTLTHLGRP